MAHQDAFYSKLPSVEQIQKIFSGIDADNKVAAEAATYRMNNYFNCVDDYSWGGICDQSADRSRSQRESLRYALKDQLENGGNAFVETFDIPVLCDMNGRELTDRVVSGKYGLCWIIGNDCPTFVGVSKKQATYNKKGYQVMTKKVKVEYYYTGGITKKGRSSIVARVLSNDLVNEFPAEETVGRFIYAVYIAQQSATETI